MAGPVAVPWPLTNNPGSAAGEGSGRLINCYAYKDGEGPRWRPVPGLDDFSEVDGAVRGWILFSGAVVAVIGQAVLSLDANGGQILYEGQVAGSGPVTMARNNAVPAQLTITSSAASYVVNGTVIGPYPDADLPAVNSVAFLDGYFLWTTTQGRIYASELNSTAVNQLSFTTAEARPDGLRRGVTYGQQFFAMGEQTIEVYQDVGGSPFPLARSTVIPIGLIGPWAVAGQDDGWGGPLCFVAQDGTVRRMDGYTPTRISNEDLERLIQAVAIKSSLVASVHTFGGNAIWTLSSPTWTWDFNCTTGNWHERQSYGMQRWRGGPTIAAFGKWLVADADGDFVYALNSDTRTEGDDPLIWGMDSGPVKQFPARVQVPEVALDFVLGQAGISEAPQAMLSWSHDGGQSWANPVTRSTGLQGNARGKVTVNRLGLSSPAGVRMRFRVSDPAYTSFAGAVFPNASGRR